jgi:hypothetical protein
MVLTKAESMLTPQSGNSISHCTAYWKCRHTVTKTNCKSAMSVGRRLWTHQRKPGYMYSFDIFCFLDSIFKILGSELRASLGKSSTT